MGAPMMVQQKHRKEEEEENVASRVLSLLAWPMECAQAYESELCRSFETKEVYGET